MGNRATEERPTSHLPDEIGKSKLIHLNEHDKQAWQKPPGNVSHLRGFLPVDLCLNLFTTEKEAKINDLLKSLLKYTFIIISQTQLSAYAILHNSRPEFRHCG